MQNAVPNLRFFINLQIILKALNVPNVIQRKLRNYFQPSVLQDYQIPVAVIILHLPEAVRQAIAGAVPVIVESIDNYEKINKCIVFYSINNQHNNLCTEGK